MPVNVLFVGMIWSSLLALKNLGVPMATVLKNLTNLIIILGDYTLYGKVNLCTRPVFAEFAELASNRVQDEANNN